MTQAATAIPSEVRERIVSVAAELFEQSGRQAMPTVDAVRRVARVDMNAASAVMREWRRAQTSQAAPVAVSVPEVVQQASSVAVVAIWLQAQELANESLRSAQAAWEVERAELDAMRQELAEAFERQAGELDAAGVALEAEKVVSVQQGQELAGVRLKLGDALSRADKADAQLHQAVERMTQAQAERDDAAKAAAEARERAAGLAGQLQAVQEHNAALLAVIKPQAEPLPGLGAKPRVDCDGRAAT